MKTQKGRERKNPMPVAELDGHLVLFRMNSDEFSELPPSDTVKLELLNGEVIAMTRPSPFHQYFIQELGALLNQWGKLHQLGRAIPDSLMKLDDDWTPAPDLVFVARKNLRRVKQKRIDGPVDLAIEVLSPSDPEIDRETKFEAYARYGIKWYWIVDLENRVLEEYQRVGASFGKLVEISFDEPFEPRLLPGLKIDLASLEW
jgi:Uma2 family endonuclease